MNSPAIPLHTHGLSLLLGRARGLFNGLGYAVTVTLLTLTGLTLQACMGDIVNLAGAIPTMRTALASATHHAWDMLLAPLFIVIGVNVAPSGGVRRLGWLLLVALLCAIWRQIAKDPLLHDPSWVAGMLATTLEASLVVAVCAYHSHVRGTSERLLRVRIEQTTLDAELQRAQLQLLRTQIEPHFLFNTLSAVRSLARTDRAATVEMLDNLIRYFDAALPRLRQDKVSLAEEMRLVEAYLSIYRVRMGTRLTYEIDLPATLADTAVPTMMLLTLVENALKHGVGPVVEGGLIRVSATRRGGTLLLKVADSGRGLEVRHGHGTGLANVRQRLLMLYGDAAILALGQAEPRGVVASLSIPVETQA